jgi:hypothetical protein
LIRLYVVQNIVKGITGVIAPSSSVSVGSMASNTSMASMATMAVANVTPSLPSSNTPNVNVYNYSNADAYVERKGNDIDVIIGKITNDIARGTGSIPGALESRYGLTKR